MTLPLTRKCDGCGKPKPRSTIARVRVKAAGKANVYLPGVALWCADCRRDNKGTWKYAG